MATAQAIGAQLKGLPLETVGDWNAFFALKTPAPDEIPVPDIVIKLAMETFDAQQVWNTKDPYTQVTFGRWQKWTKATRTAWVKVIDATIAESGIPWSAQQVGNTFAWLYDADYNNIEHIDTAALTRVHTLRKQYAKTIKRHKTQKAVRAIAALAIVVTAIVLIASAAATAAAATAAPVAATAVPATAAVSTAGIISSVTGLSPAASGLIATAGTALVKEGKVTKDEAAAGMTDVAFEQADKEKKAKAAAKSGISPITIVLIAGGGIMLTGLAVLVLSRK